MPSSARAFSPVALLALGLLALASAGCPGSSTNGTAPVSSDVPATGKLAKPGKPKTDSPKESAAPAVVEDADFPRAALFELYKAEMLGDETERHAAFKKFGLEDAQGKPVVARVTAYEAALKKFASERADEWSELLDQVEQARTAKAQAPLPVEKK